MDLTSEKAKRDARIKAKEEKIRSENGIQAPVAEVASEKKEAKKKAAPKKAVEKKTEKKTTKKQAAT
jgi:hypothetical protein